MSNKIKLKVLKKVWDEASGLQTDIHYSGINDDVDLRAVFKKLNELKSLVNKKTNKAMLEDIVQGING